MAEDIPEQPEDRQLKRQAGDRRSAVERRHSIAPWGGGERRRANRRNASDRRGLPFGVFYKTAEPLAVLYDWLRDQCAGKWSVGIEPAGDDPFKKSVKVLFELEADKDSFMANVVRRRS
jgi:hypothetical protein